jgi:hypothetical protein
LICRESHPKFMDFYYTKIMKRYITGLVVLIALAISPMATAKIFKCNGPDGPIFTDRECGPDATNVELADTSGLVGISDETKTELAEKKAEREAQRKEALQSKGNKTVINNQFTTINTEPAGYWWRRPFRPPGYDRPQRPPATPTPLPSTLGKPRR